MYAYTISNIKKRKYSFYILLKLCTLIDRSVASYRDLSYWHPVVIIAPLYVLCSGSTPYPDMTAREVMRNVHNGYRLERPSHCRSELFRVISRCWHADPDRRPEFQILRRDLAQLLEDNMNGHYVDLESFASECTDWEMPKETSGSSSIVSGNRRNSRRNSRLACD